MNRLQRYIHTKVCGDQLGQPHIASSATEQPRTHTPNSDDPVKDEIIARLWSWTQHIIETEIGELSLTLGDLESGADWVFCCNPEDWLDDEMRKELRKIIRTHGKRKN